MKSVRDVKEIIDHGEKINLENVVIGEKEHSLGITNSNGCFVLSFNGEYEIKIHNGLITFQRRLYRPCHDHDDIQSLQIATDSEPGRKEGEISWRSRGPYSGEGYDYFKVEFGPKTEGI